MSLSLRRMAALVGLCVACQGTKQTSVAVEMPPLGKVVALPSAGQDNAAIEIQRHARADWRREGDQAPLFARDRVRTDAAGVAVVQLGSGAEVALNGGSQLEVAAAGLVKLDKGEVWLNAKAPVTVETAQGSASAKSGMGTVRHVDGSLVVSWVSGSVQLHSKAGSLSLGPGEEGTADAGGIRRSYVKDAASLLAWTDRVRRTMAPPSAEDGNAYGPALLGGLGTLSAKVPGSSKPLPFHLLGEDVQVRIQDNMAVTRVEQIFRNPTGQVVEGEYRFPIPENALLTGYDMEVGGRMVRGEIVERERGRKILKQVEDEWLWRMRDPALTEWESGSTFKTRIFPIKPQEEKRIVLTHVQPLPGAGGEYRYVLPLAMGATDSPAIGKLRIHATVSSSAGAPKVTVPVYAVRTTATDKTVNVAYEAEAQKPLVDFAMTIRAPSVKDAALSTFGKGAAAGPGPSVQLTDLNTFVRAADEDTFLLRLSPTFEPSTTAAGADWLFLVDTSESRFGPDLEVEKAMLATLLDTLGPEDRVRIMAFDTFPVPMDSAWAPPTPALKQRSREFLAARRAGGASNLGDALRAARQAADAGRPMKVLILGDGATTLGETTPAALADLASRLFAHPHSVSALAIGASVDRLLLTTLAQRTHGRYFSISTGEDLFSAATRVVLGLRAPVLESPKLSFAGDVSVREVLPAALPNLASGADLLVSGRYQGTGKLVATLTGTVGGKPWRKEWTFNAGQSSHANAFVPLVYAAHKLDALALDHSKAAERELVALSKRYGIATRLTSFIVLENEAMFREFNVARNERVAWSGDSEIDYEDQSESTDERTVLAKPDSALAGASSAMGGKASVMARKVTAPAPAAMEKSDLPSPPPASTRGRAARPMRDARSSPLDSAFAAQPKTTMPAKSKVAEMVGERPSASDIGWEGPAPSYYYRPRPEWTVSIRQLATAPSPAVLDKARSLEATVRAAPMDRRARKALVTTLIGSALLDEASRALADWAALDRSNPEVHLLAGDVLKLHGDLEGALRSYASVLDLRPENTRVLTSLAAYYEARGEWQAAHPFRVSLATLKPKDMAAKVAMAVTALKAGRTDDATRAAGELVEPDRNGYPRLKSGIALSRADRETVLSIRASQSLPLLFGSSVANELKAAGLRVTMTWDRPANLDLWMSTSRESYVGGISSKSRLLTNASGQEKVFFVTGGAQGRYRAQVLCRESHGCDALPGRLVIESHGERRTVPFVLSGTRGRDVAAIRITQYQRHWSVK